MVLLIPFTNKTVYQTADFLFKNGMMKLKNKKQN